MVYLMEGDLRRPCIPATRIHNFITDFEEDLHIFRTWENKY